MKYSGAKTNCISFPLGGIGAGSVGLSGQGELIDWDIANRPNKGSRLGHTHLAVRAEKAGEVVAARVLHADLPPPYTGQGPGMYDNSGHGVDRRTQAGLPHFASLEFDAEFPFATLTFSEKEFPVAVTLRAFSPFIPLNEDDSSLPAACFEVEFANHSDSEYDLTSIFALSHYFKGPGAATAAAPGRLRFADAACPADSPQYGELTLATDAENTSFQRHWFRGAWFDSLTKYWHDLNQPGPLRDRELNTEGLSNPEIDTGMLAAHVRVAPGESKRVRWVLAWYFPNCENYWNPMPEGQVNQWRNHYATRFESSDAVAGYMLGNWTRLEEASRRFSRALYRSTLPEAALDRAASNLSVLKSATCFRLEEGAFYAFEGCHSTTGSCEGSCTHVWNYAYAMPFLFPRLERSMRELDFKYNMNAIGGMYFRLQLPLGRPGGFRPCVDGHMGGVIKTCREWKISGDAAWLRRLWPQLKANLAYAWHPDNPDRWDPEKTGVIWGRQHHTLDMELFGPNSWLTGFYLAALKAGTDMAEALGDAEAAAEYRAIFERGRKWVAENLFNGEYFVQKIDLKDRSLLEPYAAADPGVMTYFDPEAGELKYQLGSGSIIDQVLAQWHCNLVGLGDVFEPEQVRRTLESLYRYNFKPSMRDFANFCRVFCINDEAGMVICEWPHAEGRPVIGVPYAQEAMHGFEYQAAIHMIQEGMLEEGFRVIESVRDRYDGERRNPFNEIECGNNYARSMASFAVLNAASGFSFDLPRRTVGFAPYTPERPFVGFWSLETGWGNVCFEEKQIRLTVEAGSLELERFTLPPELAAQVKSAAVDGQAVEFSAGEGAIGFAPAVKIAGELLLRW